MNEQLCINWDGKGTPPFKVLLHNLGDNYNNSPYLKFDNDSSFLKLSPLYRNNNNLLYINKISFDICGDYFNTGVFNLQTSENEINWLDHILFVSDSILDGWISEENPNAEIAKKISNIVDKYTIEFEIPNNLRYLRFIMSYYNGSKIRLGNIKLYCISNNN